MADYFAVLKRTLSGFSDPKPQLRTKLYERARTTIKRQLEGRNPPLSNEALTSELDKLEKAISDIEQGYNPDYTTSSFDSVPTETVVEPDPVVDVPPIPLTPTEPQIAPVVVAEEPEPVVAIPEITKVAEPAPAAQTDLAQAAPIDLAQAQPTDLAQAQLTDLAQAPMPDLEISIPDLEPIPAEAALPLEPAIDPVGEWAKEFIASEPAAEETPSFTVPPISAILPEASVLPELEIPALPELPEIAEPIVAAAPVVPPIPSIATLPEAAPTPGLASDGLSIPPAGGFGERKSKRPKKRGFGKWLILLLVLAILGAAATFGWGQREVLIEKFGLADFFDNPTRPKPVKTIVIKPDPPEPEGVSQPSSSAPKSEKRLTAEGVEVEPAVTLPAVVPVVPTTPKAASTPGTLPVAQNAILYEKGSTAAENSIDTGRVIWKIVQEEPATGLPKEPAIRGRVEIPSRKMILIMTIKRNGDKSLPASHLIELVFAVPDDFSGGSVGQINRFVFKESEQGRGEGLVAVPARIADGIFLIALNNLDSAMKTNENLMLTRDWIDIPMQYRTGRRALITIEKGIPGEKVFKEAFAAWAKLK